RAVAKLTVPSKKKYCQRHGYDFIYYEFDDIGRFPAWGRVVGLKKYLNDYDWVFNIDTDMLIVNYDIRLEDWIDNKYNILIGMMPDYKTGQPIHISTGMLFMKNSEWSFKFLDKWWNQTKFLTD